MSDTCAAATSAKQYCCGHEQKKTGAAQRRGDCQQRNAWYWAGVEHCRVRCAACACDGARYGLAHCGLLCVRSQPDLPLCRVDALSHGDFAPVEAWAESL